MIQFSSSLLSSSLDNNLLGDSDPPFFAPVSHACPWLATERAYLGIQRLGGGIPMIERLKRLLSAI
ncbi:hypothetical protein EMIT0P218_30233 [Pseudomonas sp. IT-P218]